MEKKANKYPESLIKQYINSCEILDYDIDELEDDFDFITQVINYSNDKNFFFLCSERLKLNNDFINYLMNKFLFDDEFIWLIVQNFINNQSDPLKSLEVLISAKNLLNITFSSRFEECNSALYKLYCNQIEMIEEESKNDTSCFHRVMNRFGSSQLVTDYFAENMISELTDDFGDLEEAAHSLFFDYESLALNGTERFIIEYLSESDYALSNYALLHSYVLKKSLRSIDKIRENWDEYEEAKQVKKYKDLFDRIDNFIDSYDDQPILFNSYAFVKKLSVDLEDKSMLERYRNYIGEDYYAVLERYDHFDDFESNSSFGNEIKLIFDGIYSKVRKIAAEVINPMHSISEEPTKLLAKKASNVN